MDSKKVSTLWLKIVICIVIFFVGCASMFFIMKLFPQAVTQNVTKLEKDVTVTDTGIADAVEKVYDAVVVVSTYKSNKVAASGTGFVYKNEDNKYYLLTNYHVIKGGDKITVTFTSGKVIEVTVVGYDEYSDIAVLMLESKEELAVAEIGNNVDTRAGDTSFAVGAPLSSTFSWTVTRGIVSGKDRLLEVSVKSSYQSDYLMQVIQTDTPINAGNSGGPLCNANGEVIGITSLKLATSGVEGMGFAIPIETAIETASNIIDGVKKEQPFLGIGMVDISTGYLQYYSLIQESGLTSGVIVSGVEDGSAAEKAGIKENDIITKIDDDLIKSSAYLRYYLFRHNVGDTIKITLIRDGEEKVVEATLQSNKSTT